jgi:protein-tyrosine phosphatase
MPLNMTISKPINVLFVCLGNICRSPTAHGVFEKMVADAGLAANIKVDSSGTGSWHIGELPDRRSASAALKRGYDLSHLRARQVIVEDFDCFHYVLAMDQLNLADLEALCPDGYSGELKLFLGFGSSGIEEVPDPYYGEGDGFERVLDLVEESSQQLLQYIQQTHQL